MSDKELVIAAVRDLPESADLERISEEIAVLVKIKRARKDIADGRLVPHDEVKQRLASWISK